MRRLDDTKDILGREIEEGMWIAIGARRGSTSAGLNVRQVSAIRDVPRRYPIGATRKAVFFRMTNGREQELTYDCVILDGYEGPELG